MRYLLSIIILFYVVQSEAQQKIYQITRTTQKPQIDGNGDEAFWANLPIATDFIQSIPEPLKPSRFRTEVKMAYNEQSIFVLAICYEPKNMQLTQLCERDAIGNVNADQFAVFLDPYHDLQNGYAFKVTSSGVQQDERLINGGNPGEWGGDDADRTWDAVWLSDVKRYEDKWVAEMEIPFSALRFPNSATQEWGLNFKRIVRKLNETSFWNQYDPNLSGFLIQSGVMKGIQDLKSPLRLFLFPYLSTGIGKSPTALGNQYNWAKSGGLDFKYGLNEAFTLDATLIPDFSQVISDNLIRNLSAFEQQLAENRPFFTEGVELFNKQDMFYSRRIGSTPDGYYDVLDKFGNADSFTINKNPNVSTLYNAFKISGRTNNDLGLGIFNAVQAPMHASITDKKTGKQFKERTSDLVNYNMIVIDKALKGQNNINISNTNVASKNGTANVLGLMANLFTKNNDYNLAIQSKNSFKEEIGQYLNMNVGKVAGRFQPSYSVEYWGPKFDQTDMGIQFDFNSLTNALNLSYNNNKPKNKHLQIFRTWTNHTVEHNVLPFRMRSYNYELGLFLLFKNFVDITFNGGGKPFHFYDFYQLERLNIPILNYGFNYFSFDGSTDSRKRLFSYYAATYGRSPERADLNYRYAKLGLRYNISDKWNIDISGYHERDGGNVGRTIDYYTNDSAIVSMRNVIVSTLEVKSRYTLGPNLSINGRFRQYNTGIFNKGFFLVKDYELFDRYPLPFRPNQDENFNLANTDIFLTWIFRPGSRFILSYKQWLPNPYFLNDQAGQIRFFQNLSRSLQAESANALTARIIWFIDYNSARRTLRKKI